MVFNVTEPYRPPRVDSSPLLITSAAIHRAQTRNVGNLRDTGHSVGTTPSAAMADVLPVMTWYADGCFFAWDKTFTDE